MEWIIYLAILVMAIIVFYIVRKKNRAKEERIAKEKKKEAMDKRAIDIFYDGLSMTKEPLSAEELAQIAPFEFRYTEKAFHGYYWEKGLPVKRTTEQIIIAFLADKKEVKRMVSSDVALKEIDAFSDLFMRRMIKEAKEENKEKNISYFWWCFILGLYANIFDLIYDEKDFELYEEFMTHDINEKWAFNTTVTNIEQVQTTKIKKWCAKLLESEHYKNLVQEDLKIEQKKSHAIFLTELQKLKDRNIIDKTFLNYLRYCSKKDEQIMIREVFDEIILSEVMNKFFPEKDHSEIKPETLAIITQAHAIKTLKLIG